MYWQINVELTQTDLEYIWQHFHLEDTVDKNALAGVWQKLQSFLFPEIWAGKDEEYILVCASLGDGADSYISHLHANGQLMDAYLADLMSMEVLRKLYDAADEFLAKESLFMGERIFPDPSKESHYPVAAILETLKTKVSMNASGMLVPLKSVVYYGSVTCKKTDHDLCRQCMRKNCPFGKKPATSGAMQYSYGYQRIFGGKHE